MTTPIDTPERYPLPDRTTTVDAFADHVSRGKVATYARYGLDLIMGERGGPSFSDAFDARRFYNCHCNGGVFNLGHRNPQVIAALRDAMDRVDIGNHHLVSGYRARLAQRLAATTNGHLPGVVFGVSGGEANDLAMKTARAHTGRRDILSARGGYHGHTGLSMAAGDVEYREVFGENLPGFRQVPFDDLGAMEAAITDQTAAVILEPIPATLGMPIPSEGYLQGVQKLCHERGALFIVDEVQTGLGRTGRIWCHQHEDLKPDMLVTGKGLSGGIYPITATLMTTEVHALFEQHPFVHISTYGGSELGCVAAETVLDIIETPGFLERVEEVGRRFEAGLAGLPLTLRRKGLFMGLKMPSEPAAMVLNKMLMEAGVCVVWANNDRSVLQFLPPLILSDAEVDDIVGRVRGVFPS